MNGYQNVCRRTRFEIFLPYAVPEEIAAALQVINRIKDKNLPGRAPYTGFTHSTTQFPVYGGAWKDAGTWVYDQLLLLLIDLPIPYGDEVAVSHEVAILKGGISACYEENGARQIEIYVVTHPIN